MKPVGKYAVIIQPELFGYSFLNWRFLEQLIQAAQSSERQNFQCHPCRWHKWIVVFGVIMLDKILITALDFAFNIFHQQIKGSGHIAIAVTLRLVFVEITVIKPMAISGCLCISLNDFRAYRNFYFLNGIEHHRA